MRVTDWFVERSARGAAHASGRRLLLVGLAVVAARIWRSVPAAITLFAIT
jgi:hypothetical protein